jgi:hypothetical protein
MIKTTANKLMRFLSLFHFSRFLLIKIFPVFRSVNELVPSNEEIIHNTDKIYSELLQSGYSSNINIPTKILKDIIEYSKSSKYKGQYDGHEYLINYESPSNPSNDIWYGNYSLLKECDSVKKLVYNKDILKICEMYLGSKFKLIGCHSWWSFPPLNNKSNHQYGYHYDIDSPKFLKIFIYLTDVDLDSGPHVILPGTHKRKSIKEKFNRRIKDSQIELNKNYNDPIIKIGPKGTMFFEDTFAYHKGTTPIKPRLIMQAEFSI